MRRGRRPDLLQLASLPQDVARRDCTGDREIHSPPAHASLAIHGSFTAIIGSFRPIHMPVGTFLDGRQFGCVVPVSFVVLPQCVVVLTRARAVAWGVLCGETRGTQQSALVLTFISIMADGSPATGGSGHSHYKLIHRIHGSTIARVHCSRATPSFPMTLRNSRRTAGSSPRKSAGATYESSAERAHGQRALHGVGSLKSALHTHMSE